MMPSTNGGELSQQQPPPQQQQLPQQQNQQVQQQQQQWMAMQQYQQQWMAMQYPASAMAMQQQQQLMYGQYMPYQYQQPQQQQQQYQQQQQPQQQYQQQQQPQQNQAQIQGSSEDKKTIWIGDLQLWMDEGYLQNCFAHTGEVVSVKVKRNKQTGQSDRYGFIEFVSHAAAEKALQSYNNTMMPNAEQTFRLNWAGFSVGDKRPDTGPDLSIFVGDLSPDVTDTLLQETFASRYPSVRSAKVVLDPNTGRTKGYGFVRFGDENERSRAMTEMNGAYCSSRPMRISVATPKKPASTQPQYSSQAVVLAGGYAANGGIPQGYQSENETNTTVFVGGLDSDITDEDLRQTFSQFGEVVSVKIPIGKGCGFVQFSKRSEAEDAIQELNGSVIGSQTVRLSWGRNPGNRQNGFGHQNGGYYGNQGYGYGNQNQDPSLYAAAAMAQGSFLS